MSRWTLSSRFIALDAVAPARLVRGLKWENNFMQRGEIAFLSFLPGRWVELLEKPWPGISSSTCFVPPAHRGPVRIPVARAQLGCGSETNALTLLTLPQLCFESPCEAQRSLSLKPSFKSVTLLTPFHRFFHPSWQCPISGLLKYSPNYIAACRAGAEVLTEGV